MLTLRVAGIPADARALPAVALTIAVALRDLRQQRLQRGLDARGAPRQETLSS